MNDGIHEGHVLLMEKGMGRVAHLHNVRGIGNKWLHRYLKFDTIQKRLTIAHPDNESREVVFKVKPDHNLEVNDRATDRRFLFEVQGNTYLN